MGLRPGRSPPETQVRESGFQPMAQTPLPISVAPPLTALAPLFRSSLLLALFAQCAKLYRVYSAARPRLMENSKLMLYTLDHDATRAASVHVRQHTLRSFLFVMCFGRGVCFKWERGWGLLSMIPQLSFG